MKSAPGIAFDYRPSRALAVAIVGMTLLAILGVALGGLATSVKLPIVLATFVYGAFSLKRHLRPDIVRIARGAGGWLLVDAKGAEFPVTLVDSLRRGFLVMLGFRQEGGPIRRFVLTPDNCNADLRRRLLLTVAASKSPESPKSAR